ncbi:hypothetical protein Misp06_02167 [Microbulbifer sp. NBRC 101763]|uniref:AAA family ATPase n=1 Tax=Microbulbifer sp. NBRC 101763 TaxID=1113820 RepID=UPI0030B49982
MIKSLWIDNFKSLVDFTLPLAKFNCLVGLNGSGKSTVLQALDFISQLMEGDVEEWLKARHWQSADLNSKLTRKNNIDFRIIIDVNGGEVIWGGSFNRRSLSCTKESVVIKGSRQLQVEDGEYIIDGSRHEIVFEFQGSILSVLKESQLNETLRKLKQTVLDIRSLDLISPELLRSQSRAAKGKLGLGGEKLSALIHESGAEGKAALRKELKTIYPQLDEIKTKSLPSGWKQLQVIEHFSKGKLTSTARHVNDGMLRLMAILTQLEIGNAFLLFDEIENGINPELVEYLMDHLVDSDDQVLVTTHSPVILNFLDDEVAKKGVIYLYKNKQGGTKAKRLFEIPSLAKKLEFMGPGEAFIDTDLMQLHNEIVAIDTHGG